MELACPGNYKLQITNYKQIPNPKLQFTNKRGVLRTNFKRLRRGAHNGFLNFGKFGENFLICKHFTLNYFETWGKIFCQEMAKFHDKVTNLIPKPGFIEYRKF